MPSSPSPPIADYGLISDGRSAALVSRQGSIDWMCLPRFDSHPVFGRLVGGERAGSFSLTVQESVSVTRRYLEKSAVLETTWRTREATVRTIEGMVLDVRGRLLPQMLLVRRVESVGGPARIRLRFDPRAGLEGETFKSARRHGALVCTRGSLVLALQAAPDLEVVPGQEMDVTVEAGSTLTLLLSADDRHPLVFTHPDRAFSLLEDSDRWWRSWASSISYQGPREDSVVRSLITLRLLTYSPSGAPVAAPTTSLPERIGGDSNWDYRYAWPRDASISAASFLDVGLAEETHAFLHWLLVASGLTRPRLHVLYDLDGKPETKEREVDNAPGYRGSRPVRIGNFAGTQHQLDVYGWVVDAVWSLARSGQRLEREMWRAVSAFADFAAKSWRDPDAGIWEERGAPAHHVHSKLMAWLAVDRALRLAQTYRVRSAKRRRWSDAKEELGREIRERGYDSRRNAYVRAYGSDQLDASLLILPHVGFEDERSPRLLGTIKAIQQELSAGGPLLYRYLPKQNDDGTEGAFLPCSFWLARALAQTGRAAEAGELFDQLCSKSNDLGLFSEELDPGTGELLGNFPQALTHSALVQAALALQGVTAG